MSFKRFVFDYFQQFDEMASSWRSVENDIKNEGLLRDFCGIISISSTKFHTIEDL
jgi:hypothetical protein